MIDFLSNLDTSVFLFFNNGLRSSILDQIMMLFTGRYIWIPMYVSILLIFAHSRSWKVIVAMTISLALAVALTDQTCATIIRPVVERMRPSNLLNPLSDYTQIVDGYRGGNYGFPSCHAANSFTLAVFMLLAVRRRLFSIFIISWAILNSYSRIYLGVHYPGDLLVGAIIGSIIGFFCYRIVSIFLQNERDSYMRSLDAPLVIIPLGIKISHAVRLRAIELRSYSVTMVVGCLTALGIVIISLV